MILAAARYGERREGASPPEVLNLALRCRQWGALPFAGGLMDQPDWLMAQMTNMLNTFDAWRGYVDKPLQMSDTKFAEQNPVAWRIVMATERMRRKPKDEDSHV